jgi:hypothetical protein
MLKGPVVKGTNTEEHMSKKLDVEGRDMEDKDMEGTDIEEGM